MLWCQLMLMLQFVLIWPPKSNFHELPFWNHTKSHQERCPHAHPAHQHCFMHSIHCAKFLKKVADCTMKTTEFRHQEMNALTNLTKKSSLLSNHPIYQTRIPMAWKGHNGCYNTTNWAQAMLSILTWDSFIRDSFMEDALLSLWD